MQGARRRPVRLYSNTKTTSFVRKRAYLHWNSTMTILKSYMAFSMQNPAERYFWACYQLCVAFSSILGDSLILLASREEQSFRLNSFLVSVMRHIAACDIAISIAHILPNAVSLIAGSWALGDTLCHIKPYIGYYLFPANLSLICVLTTGKFLLLTRRVRYLSRIKAHLICSIVWITSLAYPGLMCILGKEDVSFDYRTYSCEYGWNSPTWKKVTPVMFPVLIAIVPNAIMITTTVPTLKYLVAARKSAKRTRGSVPWQGALTVLLTAGVYCVSTLPVTVYFIGTPIIKAPTANDSAWDTNHFHLLYRYGAYMAMINITSNFFIYALAITSFRSYLASQVDRVLKSLTLRPAPAQVRFISMISSAD